MSSVIVGRLPKASPRYDETNEAQTRRIIELALSKIGAGGGGGGPGSATLPIRRATRITVGLPAPGFPQIVGNFLQSGVAPAITGQFPLDAAAGAVLLNLANSLDGYWVRLYATEADLAADKDRLVDVNPTTPIILDVLVDPTHKDIRLFDVDVEGVLAFNRDDPAGSQLYYSVVVLELPSTSKSKRYQMPPSDFDLGPHPATATYKVPLASVGDLPFGYTSDDLDTESRYYFVSSDQAPIFAGLFCHTSPATDTICRHEAAYVGANIATAFLRRGRLDCSSFFFYNCFFVNDSSIPTGPYLYGGVVRDSSLTVKTEVGWVDELGVGHVLGQGTNPITVTPEVLGEVPGQPTSDIIVRTVVRVANNSFVVDVILAIANSGFFLDLSVPVPADVALLLQTPGHNKAGFSMFRAAAPDATLSIETGFRMFEWRLGDLPATDIDLGYVPIEAPGGTLVV